MRIIVIGEDIAAIKAIEKIRQSDAETEISVIALEEARPYDRDKLIDVLAQRSSRAEILYKSEDFLKNLRIQRIEGKAVERVSVARKTVTFGNKEKQEFDKLIIAGCEKYRFPDIKGTYRDEIYHLKTLDDCDTFLKKCVLFETVFVASDTVRGISMAVALAQRGKEVILSSSKDFLLAGDMDSASADNLKSCLETCGVRILTGCTVTEVLGEQTAKAVRLSEGKVIATDALIFPDTACDIRLYDNGLTCQDGCLVVNSGMQTSSHDVFAVGEVVVSAYDYGMGRIKEADDMAECLCEGLAERLPQDSELKFKTDFEIAGQQFSLSGHADNKEADAVVIQNQGGYDTAAQGLGADSQVQGEL